MSPAARGYSPPLPAGTDKVSFQPENICRIAQLDIDERTSKSTQGLPHTFAGSGNTQRVTNRYTEHVSGFAGMRAEKEKLPATLVLPVTDSIFDFRRGVTNRGVFGAITQDCNH